MTFQRDSAPGATNSDRVIGGKYRVLRKLGEGGMGAVFEAEHETIGTRVAIKVLRPEYATDENVVRRFMQEGRSAARIGHPNIIRVLDLDREPDGSLYMVQELLVGVDLAHYLEEHGQLDPAMAIRVCLPVLSALSAAHSRGILHRDLKPANIFLARDDTGAVVPKVIDFGIAKVMSGSDAGKTRDGVIMGTLDYMSPEQLFGDTTIDGRTDVWAMGAVLYQLLTGVCPFAVPLESNLGAISQFAVRVNTQPAPRIESHGRAIPPDLAAVVHRALETRREERFETIADMRDALAACSLASAGPRSRATSDAATVIGLDIGAVRPIGSTDLGASPPRVNPPSGEIAPRTGLVAGPPSGIDHVIAARPRRRGMIIGAALVVAAIAGAAILLASRRSEGPRAGAEVERSSGPLAAPAAALPAPAPAPAPTPATALAPTLTAPPPAASPVVEAPGPADPPKGESAPAGESAAAATVTKPPRHGHTGSTKPPKPLPGQGTNRMPIIE